MVSHVPDYTFTVQVFFWPGVPADHWCLPLDCAMALTRMSVFKYFHNGSSRRDEWLFCAHDAQHNPLQPSASGQITFRRVTKRGYTAFGSCGRWRLLTNSHQILFEDFACCGLALRLC